MPNRSSKKNPRDVNQLAKAIVDRATDETPLAEPQSVDDPLRKAAAELGRRGGLKGGPARAAKLSKRRLAQIARKAAKARWDKKPPK